MAEFVGGEPISVGVDEPITFENKTDTAFDVDCGIVFHKSGLYRVSIVGRHISVAVEPERKTGRWIKISPAGIYECSECHGHIMTKDIDCYDFCHKCGTKMEGERDEVD